MMYLLYFLQIIAGLSYRYLRLNKIILMLSNKYRFIYNVLFPSLFIYILHFHIYDRCSIDLCQNMYFNYSVLFFIFS